MKHCIYILAFIIFQPLHTFAQLDFRYDNIIYKTILPTELCSFLNTHPDAVLLDVRTPGEFMDTSVYSYLNIGHLRGARNIEKDSVTARMGELRLHQDKPMLIYCSHSQRSRKVSKTLVDSGFTQVYNVMGGMSWLNQQSLQEFPCRDALLQHLVRYKSISAREAIGLIKTDKKLVILDVRSKQVFNGMDTTESNNVGRIKNAINIPVYDFDIRKLERYRSATILIYDNDGAESGTIADSLSRHGFKNVMKLTGGMFALIDWERSAVRNTVLVNRPRYNILNSAEAVALLKSNKNLLVLDVRDSVEYNNKSAMVWHNLGTIKNAKHIEPADFNHRIGEYGKDKTRAILVYTSMDGSEYADDLARHGFKNVSCIRGGFFRIIANSANRGALKSIKGLLSNYEGLY